MGMCEINSIHNEGKKTKWKKRKGTGDKTYKTQRNQNLGTQKDFVLPCLKHR